LRCFGSLPVRCKSFSLCFQAGSNPTLSAITFVIWELQAGDTYTDTEIRRDHCGEPRSQPDQKSRNHTRHAVLPRCFVSKRSREAGCSAGERQRRTPPRRRVVHRVARGLKKGASLCRQGCPGCCSTPAAQGSRIERG